MQKEDVVSTFKKNLVAVRKKRGLSQRELAKKMNATQRIVAYYEKEAANIPLTKLQDLARALDVTVVELLDQRLDKAKGVEELDVRIIRKIKQIEGLPRRAQEALWHTINTTLEMQALKAAKKK
ncbi:MAG: helix-turn-helix transcriptional regulator [Chitinivibrionales bacterium]|nr:helix-turn-helix transcriptional regulator [Chitinivibrionales bacterium]